MSAYIPVIGDIVRCGPGCTRFTVRAVTDGWAKLEYPHGLGVITRRWTTLEPILVAPRAVPSLAAALDKPYAGPTSRNTLVKRLRSGDVLVWGRERLTVRNIWCARGVRVTASTDWRYTVWVTDPDGKYRQMALSTVGPVRVEIRPC